MDGRVQGARYPFGVRREYRRAIRQVSGAYGFFPKRAFDETQQAVVAAFFARRLPR
ncbi:hypothetical protein PV350_24655 [Streptomyces sp. PA03-6a]|nr:hypothetical protein [Streptomyces sp. PA03-6a]